MKIYTKTGDLGETSLYGGRRVVKNDLQVETYGTVDELSSFLGLSISKTPTSEKQFLIEIQKDLWKVMAVLSGSTDDLSFLEERIAAFEKKIDTLTKKLPELRRFILPGGNELSSLFHVTRTICRKAERRCVGLGNAHLKLKIKNFKLIVKYLNRLSDLLFTYARWYGKNEEITT